jgi:uncharacterized protein YecE (DUF72 family)
VRRRAAQLDLFTPPRAVGPARVPAEVAALASRLPSNLRLGTSSWSFPGWVGLVWDRAVTAGVLARDGLHAYARHPLLRAVGIDRTFYGPIDADAFAAMAAQVPDDFRFLVKAHEVCTLHRFPQHERYGERRGLVNQHFLHAGYATNEVIRPAVEGLGGKAGPILFQLPPQATAAMGGAGKFAERLHAFLEALPRGPLYAVELRTPDLLTRDYAAVLHDVGAVHCVNAHPTMPAVTRQAERTRLDDAPAVVVRWMLGHGQAYEAAVERYRPFDRIVDPDDPTRAAIAALCRRAGARPAYVIVNNKAEGSAPESIRRLVAHLSAG